MPCTLLAESVPADLPYTSRVYTSPDGKLALLCVDNRLGGSIEGDPMGNPESRDPAVVLFRNDASREVIWKINKVQIGDLYWDGETVPGLRTLGQPRPEGSAWTCIQYAGHGLGIISEDGSRFVTVRKESTFVQIGGGDSANFGPGSMPLYEVTIYRDGKYGRTISDPYFVENSQFRQEWDSAIVARKGGQLDRWILLYKDSLRLRIHQNEFTDEYWEIDLAKQVTAKHWTESKPPVGAFIGWLDNQRWTWLVLAGLIALAPTFLWLKARRRAKGRAQA